MAEVTVVNRSECRRQIAVMLGYTDAREPNIQLLMLEIGANLIDSEAVAQFRKNPNVEALFKKGILELSEAPKADQDFDPEAYKVDLSRLKFKAARDAIAACEDPKQLRVWIDQDARADVRKLIMARHKELLPQAAPENEEAVDDSDDE